MGKETSKYLTCGKFIEAVFEHKTIVFNGDTVFQYIKKYGIYYCKENKLSVFKDTEFIEYFISLIYHGVYTYEIM